MNKSFFLNSTFLKILAMIIILLDHVGYFLVSPFGDTEILSWLLRGIGRLGFPLYAFFIVEGIIHSRNIKNYLLKILALALVISTFQVLSLYSPLSQYFYIGEAYNVFLTLFVGGITVAYFHIKKYRRIYMLIPLLVLIITNISALYIEGDWQILLVNEYRIYGLVMIFGFYLAYALTPKVRAYLVANYQAPHEGINTPQYTQKINNYLSCISLLFVNLLWYILSVTIAIVPFDGFQTYSIFTAILILVYNGEKGYQPVWFRWVYYLFYPAHLVLLAVISLLIS